MGTRLRATRIKALIAAAGVALSGCVESTFVLAPESRLPAWFEVPSGQSRADVTVQMNYYVFPSGREASFILLDTHGHKLATKRGTLRGLQPIKPQSQASYEVITVNGVTDLIEHRRSEPVFCVSDDPVVRKQLGIPIRGHEQ